ncbi:hypothetical protein ACQ4PT_053590 [Festuca glaucescens]
MPNSNVTVCVRFRPLSHKERKGNDDKVCFKKLDSESFVFKDERDEDVIFSFDKVFYDDSEQSDVYNFLAMPIVTDAVNGINGTIITYGQTGAGKTYSMEGPSILHCNELKTGLVQRVVNGLFECLRTSANITTWTVKLSMVEIYLEKVSTCLYVHAKLFLFTGQNYRKELPTELLEKHVSSVSISETVKKHSNFVHFVALNVHIEMNLASSRSHCLYIFSVQHGSTTDERVRAGKIILVDLAGSEKVEKTGAEGRVLDEAKMINKSLSALGNVINALTTAKPNHVPYRDSKLTRILQDSLGGSSRAALLCCCSPSSSNSPESLSTIRFGTRTKLIKTLHKLIPTEVDSAKKYTPYSRDQDDLPDGTLSKAGSSQSEASDPSFDSGDHDSLRERLLSKLRLSLKEEDIDLLEELFVLEGIIFDPDSVVLDIDSACHDAASRQIASLVQAVEELTETVQELTDENETLRHQLEVAQEIAARAQCAAADRSGGALFGFVPAAVLRLVGFMPD